MHFRHTPALTALLLAGCGPTLYDATGAPALVPTCTADAPVLCLDLDACAVEDAEHCGASCSHCQTFIHAAAFCDTSSPELDQHTCDYVCDPGFEREPNGPGCRCPVGTALCGGACGAEDVGHCGATCQACSSAPANGAPSCNLSASACGFTCASGYVPSSASCVCAPGTVACGGGVGGTCIAESVSACGPTCRTCTAPPTGTPVCSNHVCGYVCPAGQVQCTSAGQPSCCTAVCGGPPVIQCGASCLVENINQCGTSCADCTNPSTNPIPPGGLAQPACLGQGTGTGTCGFSCPPGFLKSLIGSGACVQVASGDGAISLGAKHTCVLTTAGEMACWGANESGQLGVGDTLDRHTPVDVALVGGAGVAFIGAGASHTCAATTTGRVLCWGLNDRGQLGQPLTTSSSTTPLTVPGAAGAVAVAAGAKHTCAVLSGGKVWCWGANDQGQLGQPLTTSSSAVPLPVDIAGTASKIATQVDHTCVLATSGDVWCWGANGSGQTSGTSDPTVAPAHLTIAATSIAVGAAHSCGVTAGGVLCWGDGILGELGNGLTTPSSSRTPLLAIQLNSPASMVADGSSHTCAGRLLNSGLKCAGANNSGQVGLPASPVEPRGADITIGTAIDRLAAGGDRSCVLSAGALKCWGANDRGQLGNDSVADSPTPVSPQPF